MNLASVLFNFIFYKNSSFVSQIRRDDCINFCSTFFINALPGVDDSSVIKQSREALMLVNDTKFMKPIEFHTSIMFDFNRKKWQQKDLFGSKLIEKDHWTIDKEYGIRYPKLNDSKGILSLIFIKKCLTFAL